MKIEEYFLKHLNTTEIEPFLFAEDLFVATMKNVDTSLTNGFDEEFFVNLYDSVQLRQFINYPIFMRIPINH